ncbi:MAG: exo-alpha-sialidase [Ruminococcaceae bacterium]|nr:exo-alpha-sialidase [Oscillospiraceae bacterium]
MKKILSFLLATSMAFPLCSCSEPNSEVSGTEPSSAESYESATLNETPKTETTEPETEAYTYDVIKMDVSGIVLYVGSKKYPYCAFPTLVETNDGILCAWKQGISHMGDESITSYMWLDKDGSVHSPELLAHVPGFNTQNAELLTMPDGTIRCYLDIQDYNNGKTRTGTIVYEYRNGTFEPLPGILTDTDGKQYGYVFDGLEWQGRYWMLAMTFPELDYPDARKSVELLVSDDNGETWTDMLCLDTLLDASLNESTLAVFDNKLYILCRGYDKKAHIAVLDDALNLLNTAVYDKSLEIYNTGRPKLFVRDGNLYSILRNHCTENSAMDLSMLRINPENLVIEQKVILDAAKPQDGYYAEHYFVDDTFNLITYKPNASATPDITLLTFDWNEIR